VCRMETFEHVLPSFQALLLTPVFSVLFSPSSEEKLVNVPEPADRGDTLLTEGRRGRSQYHISLCHARIGVVL
jgi:hypothetical protein